MSPYCSSSCEKYSGLWLLHRLCCQPDVLPHILRWESFHMGYFTTKKSPGRVQPPHQRRNPPEPILNGHELQRGKRLEHTFSHHTDDVRLHRLGWPDVVLHVVRGPSGAGDRIAVRAKRVR